MPYDANGNWIDQGISGPPVTAPTTSPAQAGPGLPTLGAGGSPFQPGNGQPGYWWNGVYYLYPGQTAPQGGLQNGATVDPQNIGFGAGSVYDPRGTAAQQASSQPGQPGQQTVAQMLAANPGMQPWIAQTYVQNGITPGPDGSGAGDWRYWQGTGLQNANGDTNYLSQRIVQAQTGQGNLGDQPGQSSSGSNYAPLFQPSAPFSYGQAVPNVGAFNYQPLGDQQQFTAPTGQQALDQDPGYQFRLQQGQDSLINSAAARGGLGDPNTLRAVQDYGQQSASQEYGNAYNRALQTYQTNTGTNLAAQQQQYQQGLGAFQTNASTQLGQQQQGFSQALQGYQTNFEDPLAAYNAQTQANLGYGNLALGQGAQSINQGYLGLAANNQQYNQLYGAANLGLNATNSANQTGLGYYNGLSNLYGQNANAQTGLITGIGNANAAGQVGVGNAWSGAGSNLANIGAALAAYQNAQRRQNPPPPGPNGSNGGGW